MVDVVKGAVTAIVGIITLVVIYFTYPAISQTTFVFLLLLIIIEGFLLFWFVFRGDGKKIRVNPQRFLIGVIAGYILIVFLFTAFYQLQLWK